MAIPTWGTLKKSQVDNETIESAIARLIQAHDDDETAHLETGQSLQSHKASEIIDHLAGSIIEDKLGNLQITPKKLNQNIIYNAPALESIDAYNKITDGTGGSVILETLGMVAMKPGAVNGNRAVINVDNSSIPAYTENDPFCQIWVSDAGDEASHIAVSFGMQSPFDTSNGGFGIEFVKGDNKVYGFYNTYYSSSWHRVRVLLHNGAPYGEIWRAEWDHVAKTIKFYINNVLISTADNSAHYYEDDDDYWVSFGVKQATSTPDAWVRFMNPIWGQGLG